MNEDNDAEIVADDNTGTGVEDQNTGIDGDDGAEDLGGTDSSQNKSPDSMLSALEDGDGVTFDFTGDEKPEGFPDEYWDDENKGVNAQALYEGLQKQEKIAKDLRSKMGKGDHKPPAKPEDYKLDLPEEIASQLAEGDKTIAAAQKRAHELGISQDAYQGFMAGMIEDLVAIAAEHTGEPTQEQLDAQEAETKQRVQDEIKAIGPNGPQVLRAVESWGKQMLAEGRISEASLEAMTNEGLVSAPMVRMFNELRSSFGGSPIPVDTGDDGLPPDAEIAEMIDKAYASKDPAKIRKTDELLDKRRAAGRPDSLQF